MGPRGAVRRSRCRESWSQPVREARGHVSSAELSPPVSLQLGCPRLVDQALLNGVQHAAIQPDEPRSTAVRCSSMSRSRPWILHRRATLVFSRARAKKGTDVPRARIVLHPGVGPERPGRKEITDARALSRSRLTSLDPTPRDEDDGTRPRWLARSLLGPRGRSDQTRNGLPRRIVSPRSAPTEMQTTGMPTISSTRRTYRWAAGGRSSMVLAPARLCSHPGSSS